MSRFFLLLFLSESPTVTLSALFHFSLSLSLSHRLSHPHTYTHSHTHTHVLSLVNQAHTLTLHSVVSGRWGSFIWGSRGAVISSWYQHFMIFILLFFFAKKWVLQFLFFWKKCQKIKFRNVSFTRKQLFLNFCLYWEEGFDLIEQEFKGSDETWTCVERLSDKNDAEGDATIKWWRER